MAASKASFLDEILVNLLLILSGMFLVMQVNDCSGAKLAAITNPSRVLNLDIKAKLRMRKSYYLTAVSTVSAFWALSVQCSFDARVLVFCDFPLHLYVTGQPRPPGQLPGQVRPFGLGVGNCLKHLAPGVPGWGK